MADGRKDSGIHDINNLLFL